MTLDFLQKEMIAAMKNKDKERKNTISSLVQAVQKFGIDNKCKDNITEAQIDAVILKEKKTVQEMIDTCPSDRVETLEEYKTKLAIINEFAPSLMDNEEDIKKFIQKTGLELVKSNRGKIMAALKGKADMKVANKVVGSMIS
jgi:uncharacterized protein YqeY